MTETLKMPTLVSLSRWMDEMGIAPVTAWRWRKKGLLQTVNIQGRLYLTREAVESFTRRAAAGEFAKVHVTPTARRAANSHR